MALPPLQSSPDSEIPLTTVQGYEDQRRTQRQVLDAVRRVAGTMAHDFNNLLTVIGASAEFLEEATPAGDTRRSDIQQILDATERASSLTRQLLAFSQKQVMHAVVFRMNDTLRPIQGFLEHLLGARVHLTMTLGGDVGAVCADLDQVEQVVTHLAANARDAMPNGGTCTVETRRVPRMGEDGVIRGYWVQLVVADTGAGMNGDTLAHVFEPFFTTKRKGGLGLAIVYGVVQQSGGDVTIHSTPGVGTRVEVLLPEVDDGSTSSHPSAGEAPGT